MPGVRSYNSCIQYSDGGRENADLPTSCSRVCCIQFILSASKNNNTLFTVSASPRAQLPVSRTLACWFDRHTRRCAAPGPRCSRRTRRMLSAINAQRRPFFSVIRLKTRRPTFASKSSFVCLFFCFCCYYFFIYLCLFTPTPVSKFSDPKVEKKFLKR